MNRNNFYLRLSGLIVLMAIVACVIPSQSLPSAPTTNSNAIETFIAGTARVSAKQTKQAVPATTIPAIIPIDTFTPTPKISVSGTSLVVHEDQSATFIDHTAGIQLTIPSGWMPIRPGEEEYYKAFTLDVVVANQDITNRLTRIQNADTDFFRLDAIDIRDGHVHHGIISDINVIFQAGDTRSLETWAQAEKKKKQPFVNFKFISSSYPHTANGTRVLIIEESWAADSEVIYYRGVFFSLPTGTIVLDFYSDILFKDTVLPDLEQVVNSVTFLNP